MVVPGVALFLVGIAYFFLTQDAPLGNYKDLRATGLMPQASQVRGTFLMAAKDYRVWALFIIYGACFGVELTINNIAVLYYFDRFELALKTAGLIAGLFGLMNLFARTLGGVFGDKLGIKFGLKGRVMFLGVVLLIEGIALMVFSQMATLFLAVGAMIVFSLFVQMSEGATFSVVPFVNHKALGSVAGIVGAVAFGFLFRAESISYQEGLLFVGVTVLLASALVFLVRFSPETEAEEKRTMEEALAARGAAAVAAAD